MSEIFDGFSRMPTIFLNALSNLPMFKKRIDEDYDKQLIYDIQPVGGLKTHENYITLGDGYMTCISIYAAPEKISRHWLYPLFKISNAITSIDVRTLKTTDVKDTIKRNYEEQFTRYDGARDIIEAKDAQNSMVKLEGLLNEISELGNVMLAVDLKVYIVGRTFAEFEQNIINAENILGDCGFAKFNRNINEQKQDFVNLFLSPTQVQETLNNRPGLPVPSNIMAQSLPFYHVNWQDKNGYYLGDTYTSKGVGSVIFNNFLLDNERTCYDFLCCGRKGYGKSTILKYIIEQTVVLGNRVRILDVTGEFGPLVRNMGGTVIDLGINKEDKDYKEVLNPLEILRMDENDTENYLNHISKLSLMYRLKNPNSNETEVDLFKLLLKKLYTRFNIIPSENTTVYENITGLPSTKYPRFSDLLKLTQEEIDKISKESNTEAKLMTELLIKIKIALEDIVGTYGSIFDRYTNIPQVTDIDIVSYDLSSLVNLESNIFDMQLFNVLHMAYDSCMTMGMKMKHMYDNGKISLDDVMHHLIILDEFTVTVNATKPFAVKKILNIFRQDRKYFIGVGLATQNIADGYKGGNEEVSKDIKSMFELCQYKMILNHDPSSIPDIEDAFQNILTSVQIESIPHLQKREFYLCLNSKETIKMTMKTLPKSKLAYYGGGA